MAKKNLTVSLYVTREEKKINVDNLSFEEKRQLAYHLNSTAMQAAGYIEKKPLKKVV